MSQVSRRIIELFTPKPTFSVEFFPPKNTEGERAFFDTVAVVRTYHPLFVSITCGAGGSTRSLTATCAKFLAQQGLVILPHTVCGHETESTLAPVIQQYTAQYGHTMALRGDCKTPPPAGSHFRYASEWVSFIKKNHPDCGIGVAGYPEKHPESATMQDDLRWLKHKVDAGADFVTTQLFFENALFYSYCKRCQELGIRVPIIPGILPTSGPGQLKRLQSFCAFSVPSALSQGLSVNDPDHAREHGIEWAIRQVTDLWENQVHHVHLCLLNNPSVAEQILSRLSKVM